MWAHVNAFKEREDGASVFDTLGQRRSKRLLLWFRWELSGMGRWNLSELRWNGRSASGTKREFGQGHL